VPESVLIYGSPELEFDLFHAVPAGITDPFLYVENGERRVAVISVLDADKVRAAGVEAIDPISLGRDELFAQGLGVERIELETCLRACRELGVEAATVPFGFPVAVADHLRAAGIDLRVDQERFVARRRVKTPGQLEGIRRAQRAADAAMAVAAELIHALAPGTTSEGVREAMKARAAELGAELADDVIVAHGGQGAVGHDSGSGAIAAGEPVIVDIWPRDAASRCWSDMTRTFVAGGGEPPEELATYWRLARESLDAVYALLRPGVNGRELFEASSRPFADAGYPTQLTKAPGEVLQDGYFHSLGHGVGLELHERPLMGRLGDDLLEGEVVAIEPGCYRRGFGGCRLEDLVLITAAGCETLTDFPYDL
jgi:Xaa-Pro aminopeptidase